MPHGRKSAACQWSRPADRPSPNSRSRLFIRGRDPRIPSCVARTQSVAGTSQAKFPPASVRRLGYEVVGTLTRFYEDGGPAPHACFGPTGIRSARLSQGETPVLMKNKSAVTGPSPSLDEPCRTHRKARPASGLGLWPSVPEFPLTLVHTRPGPRAANSLLRREYADGLGPYRSALASRTFYALARMFCGLQLIGVVILSMWQQRACLP